MKKAFSASELPDSAENIFGFEDPDKYICKMIAYTESHSSMLIRLTHAENKAEQYYLELNGVFYFHGYTSWTGANFCTETPEDYLSLIFKEEDSNDIIDHLIKEEPDRIPKVISIRATHGLIRLAANGLWLTDKKPRFFGI